MQEKQRAHHVNGILAFPVTTHTLDACCLVHSFHQLEDTSGHCRGSDQTVFVLGARKEVIREKRLEFRWEPMNRTTHTSSI